MALLCSILYAEQESKNKKKILYYLEKLLKKIGAERFFCKTLGMWSIDVQHASFMQYSKKRFRQMIADPYLSTKFIISYLHEKIGLDLPVECIFAEYNYGLLTTSTVALQRVCNILSKTTPIIEDGLLGKKSKERFENVARYFPPEFSLKNLTRHKISEALEYINKNHGTAVVPFVPSVVSKNIFFHSVDIPRYVKYGLYVYRVCLNES